MLPDAAIVLQARMGSARLPGKVLASIAGRPLLRHCLERLILSGVGPVVLATTTRTEDDAVAAEGRRLRVAVVRGDEVDVLSRFATAARGLGATFIVRATGDNPAVDIEAARRALNVLCDTGAGYCCESGLPLGAAVEAMTTDALLDANERATSPADREHVTPFIRRERSRYRVVDLAAPPDVRRPDVRLTVDTRQDLEYIRGLARLLPVPLSQAPLAEIIAAADELASLRTVA